MLDLSDDAYMEFTADGTQHRIDPIEWMDRLAAMDKEHGAGTAELFSAVAGAVQHHCGVKECTRVGGMRFYYAVIEFYEELMGTLKKTTGSAPKSPIGSTSIPADGQPLKSGSGSDSLTECTLPTT